MSGIVLAAALAAATAPATGAADCHDEPEIAWQVEGGFATLRPEAAARGDALLDAIARAGGRLQPASDGGASAYDEIVAALVGEGGAATPLYKLTWWDRAKERYVFNDAVLTPPAVTIRAHFAAGGAGACLWSVDGLASQQPCGDAPLTLRRGAGGLRGTIAVRAESGAAASGCAAVSERLIVGLGDSYASGEGNPDEPTRWAAVPEVATAPVVRMPAYRDGRRRDRLGLWDRRSDGPLAHAPDAADAKWWDNSCHRSLLSQQALAALSYAAANRHRRVLFLSFACSGATVFDGVAGPRLEAPGVFRPGGLGIASPALRLSQIEQLADVLCAELGTAATLPVPPDAPTWRTLTIRGKRPHEPRTVRVPRCNRYRQLPDALLLSVGGNDVGAHGRCCRRRADWQSIWCLRSTRCLAAARRRAASGWSAPARGERDGAGSTQSAWLASCRQCSVFSTRRLRRSG